MIFEWADQSWNARSKCRRTRGYGLWRIEHMADRTLGVNFNSLSGVLQVSLEAGYVSYKTLVRLVLYVAALVVSGS